MANNIMFRLCGAYTRNLYMDIVLCDSGDNGYPLMFICIDPNNSRRYLCFNRGDGSYYAYELMPSTLRDMLNGQITILDAIRKHCHAYQAKGGSYWLCPFDIKLLDESSMKAAEVYFTILPEEENLIEYTKMLHATKEPDVAWW